MKDFQTATSKLGGVGAIVCESKPSFRTMFFEPCDSMPASNLKSHLVKNRRNEFENDAIDGDSKYHSPHDPWCSVNRWVSRTCNKCTVICNEGKVINVWKFRHRICPPNFIITARESKSCASIGTLLLLMSFITGCATLTGRERMLWGVGMGAGAGAVGGAALSPNHESQGLNTLVFGLAGALVGGGGALLSDSHPIQDRTAGTLREREHSIDKATREFQVLPSEALPSFLKDRVQPMVIEESTEADSVAEDGTLHEPHRVYRIKRPGELFAKPAPSIGGTKQ